MNISSRSFFKSATSLALAPPMATKAKSIFILSAILVVMAWSTVVADVPMVYLRVEPLPTVAMNLVTTDQELKHYERLWQDGRFTKELNQKFDEYRTQSTNELDFASPYRYAYFLAKGFVKKRSTTNDTEVVSFLQKATARGSCEAAFALGCLYGQHRNKSNWPVVPNTTNSFAFYKTAANGGHARAMARLGISYFYGIGCPVNLKEAYRWTSMAADRGVGIAQMNQICSLARGYGVEKNVGAARIQMLKYADHDYYAYRRERELSTTTLSNLKGLKEKFALERPDLYGEQEHDGLFSAFRQGMLDGCPSLLGWMQEEESSSQVMQEWLGDYYSEGIHTQPNKDNAVYWYSRTGCPYGSEVATKLQRTIGVMPLYFDIDLSQGVSATNFPLHAINDTPTTGWSKEYKTNHLVLRRVDPGNFPYGSWPNEPGRFPNEPRLRWENVERPFYIGIFELTQKQWELVMGTKAPAEGSPAGPDLPVSGTIWNQFFGGGVIGHEHEHFLSALAKKTGLDFGCPTDIEWEYACRAVANPKEVHRPTNVLSNINEVARFVDTGNGPAVVGSYKPNAWGIYDMQGNVWEWTWDSYNQFIDFGFMHNLIVTNSLEGAISYNKNKQYLAVRGGAWTEPARNCRPGSRYLADFDKPHRAVGFRLKMTLPDGSDSIERLADRMGVYKP